MGGSFLKIKEVTCINFYILSLIQVFSISTPHNSSWYVFPSSNPKLEVTLVFSEAAAFIQKYSCEVQCEGSTSTLCFRVSWGCYEWENI